MNTPPLRIQRRRTKGWRMPENTVYVGRPSRWANPFLIAFHSQEISVMLFHRMLLTSPADRKEQVGSLVLLGRWDTQGFEAIHELRGKNLACWCPPYRTCHADVLLEIANSEEYAR